MSTPAAACLWTTSSTAAATRSESAPASTGTPSSLAYIIRIRSSGRGRLPVCVVRNLSVLRSMTDPLLGSATAYETTQPARLRDAELSLYAEYSPRYARKLDRDEQ